MAATIPRATALAGRMSHMSYSTVERFVSPVEASRQVPAEVAKQSLLFKPRHAKAVRDRGASYVVRAPPNVSTCC
eukprot:scaffold394076_cov18-Prasinocladus_malaysianus.AAC.1